MIIRRVVVQVGNIVVERIEADGLRGQHLSTAAHLLVDAVQSGASVGWVFPPSLTEAEAYWISVASEVEWVGTVVLGAFDGELLGLVMLVPCTKANGIHRGEVARLLVHSSARRRGIGRALMQRVEREAARLGISLLVLDTRTRDPSETLYKGLGYQIAGIIPDYTKGATGALEPTTLLYRSLPSKSLL